VVEIGDALLGNAKGKDIVSSIVKAIAACNDADMELTTPYEDKRSMVIQCFHF